jgi:hypothetical protein
VKMHANLRMPSEEAVVKNRKVIGAGIPCFYGWWVVLASAVGLFWGVPVSVYSFSVFFKPLMQEFHASRAAVSLAFTLNLLTAALGAAPMAD